MILTFTAPNRPLSENESRRLHWAQRKRRLEPWAWATRAAWRETTQADRDEVKGEKLSICVFLPFARSGRRDPHNYVGTNVKTIIDALIREGLAPDDTPEYIQVLEPELVVDKEARARVFIIPVGRMGIEQTT